MGNIRQDNSNVYIDIWNETLRFDKNEYALYQLNSTFEIRISMDTDAILNYRLNGVPYKVSTVNGRQVNDICPYSWESLNYIRKTINEAGLCVNEILSSYGVYLTPNWKEINKKWLVEVDRLEKIFGEALGNAAQATLNNQAHKYQQAYSEELSKDFGLSFGILSSSLTSHLLYAAQSAAKEQKDHERAERVAADAIKNSHADITTQIFDTVYPIYTDSLEPAMQKLLSEYYAYIIAIFSKELHCSYDDVVAKFEFERSNGAILHTSDNARVNILEALQVFPNNGNVIGYAIKNGVLDDELCEYGKNASESFGLTLKKWAISTLREIYKAGKLFNKPLVTNENRTIIEGLKQYYKAQQPNLNQCQDWQDIITTVFLEDISKHLTEFAEIAVAQTSILIPEEFDKLARSGVQFSLSNESKSLFVCLYHDLAFEGAYTSASFLDLTEPFSVNDIVAKVHELNEKINSRSSLLIKQEAERRRAEEQHREAERQEELKRQAEKEKQKQQLIQKAKKVTMIMAIITIIISIVAFVIYWCSPASKFEYVEEDDSHINITKVNERAIKDGTLAIPDKIFGKIVIGIQPNALANTETVTIIIPASMTEFDMHTFDKCTKLKSIDFKGTVGDWLAITNIHDFDKYNLTHTGECDFSEWYFEEGFDCTQGGTQFKTCNMCKAEESRFVNAGEHTDKTLNAISPTCTQSGLTEGKQCTICEIIFVEQQTISPLGHTIVVDYAKSPTCTQTGLTEGKHCSVCNITIIEQRTINKESHSLEGWKTVKNPICTQTGTERNSCANCSYYVERVAVSTGHSFTSNHCSKCGIEKPSQGLLYNVVSGGYEVADIGSCTDTRIVLPDYYNGKPVVSIGNNAFASINTISEIIMQEGLLRIGDSAFSYSSITTARIPNSVTFIGEDAFDNCDSLISVYLGTGLTSTGGTIFAWCDDLTSIYCPSVEMWCKAGLQLFYCGETKVYFNGVLAEDITIPGSVNKIHSDAFSDILTLTTVRISEGITEISWGAFYDQIRSYYGKLTVVYLPSTITKIGSDSFPYTVETVYYNGTMAEWQAVTNYAYFAKVICTDGIVTK